MHGLGVHHSYRPPASAFADHVDDMVIAPNGVMFVPTLNPTSASASLRGAVGSEKEKGKGRGERDGKRNGQGAAKVKMKKGRKGVLPRMLDELHAACRESGREVALRRRAQPGGHRTILIPTQLPNDLTTCWQTVKNSFSTPSKPKFVNKCSLEGS